MPGELSRLEQAVEVLETKALLSGPLDANPALLTINARDGGTDANDWAEMLLRMYLNWAKDHDYETEILDRQDNEEAGINSATIAVRGPMAYGYLKGESGIHRLVRISPFNAEGKRQTSFAAVDVSPEVSEQADIEIRRRRRRGAGVSGQRPRRAARQQDLQRRAADPSSHGHRRGVPERAEPAQEPGDGDEDAPRPAGPRRGRETRGRTGGQVQPDAQGRLRLANPQLFPPPRPAGQGRADRPHARRNFHNVLDGHIQEFLDAYLRHRAGERR